MDFNECLSKGKVKKVTIDELRAKSMIEISRSDLKTSLLIPLKEESKRIIFRELYEIFKTHIEGIGYLKGYKFLDHISITYFLRDVLDETHLSEKFDRYRKLRNGINYYGEDIDFSSTREALETIPRLINYLNKYINI